MTTFSPLHRGQTIRVSATIGCVRAGAAAGAGAADAAAASIFKELTSWVNDLTFIYSMTANAAKATKPTNSAKFFTVKSNYLSAVSEVVGR
jgi:hypothetical protein